MFRRHQQQRPLPPPTAYQLPAQPPAAAPVEHKLSPAQLRPIDWTEPDAQQPLAKKPVTYVPSASDIIQMPSVTMASPDANVNASVTPFATIEGKTLGSHSDRARAWTRYSIPLCVAFGVVTTAAAIGLYGVPVLSWSAFITFWATFVVAYVVLLLNYWRHTPEGVALDSSRQLWGYLRMEQRHRHELERSAWDMQQQRIEERSRRNG